MIIAVANEKGGCTKTTTAANLAVIAAHKGKRVVLLDADPQESATIWAEIRQEAGETPVIDSKALTGDALVDAIEGFERDYDLVIIDVGGRDSAEFRAALLSADRVIMPVRPGYSDSWGVQRMSGILKATGKMAKIQINAFAVICAADPNANSAENRGMRDLLGEYTEWTVCKSMLRRRKAFERSLGAGQGVSEMTPADEKAILEIEHLYKEVCDYE